jgi:alkanesulfonate monooxygenase SsuD/methylene tetrahydromethanopterin reductase-like flavin-dependent oxidoreductase (luciferase family)
MKLSVVILPIERWERAALQWRQLDEWGVHAGYVYDHLSWREPFRDGPWFAMIPTLAAAAGVTRQLRLGPLVTSPNFRHPLVLGKDLLALDDLSRGRLVVGVGSGGTGFDASTLGQAPWTARERHEHFVEFTRVLDRVLRDAVTNWPGPHYPVVDSRQLPGALQQPRPPLYLSALGPRALALTAELADGWVSYGARPGEDLATFDALRSQVARLDEELRRHGREPRSLWRVLLHFASEERPTESLEAFVDWAGRYQELGMDEVVLHWPVAGTAFAADATTFEEICVAGSRILADWN